MLKVILAAAVLSLGLIALVFPSRAPAQANDGNRKLFHVVSLKFKQGATQDQIKQVEEAFAALKDKVPGVVVMTWGTNVSPEKHDKGFTHCFILAFDSDKDRDAYLAHPEHKAFGKVLGPVLGDVFVLDFWGTIQHGQ
jgi:stress responsive alpha/beta barrel protein